MNNCSEDNGAIRLRTLAQLARAGAWQMELVHDRPQAVLIWMTRGQGRCLLNGARRGLGTHNAIFVPSRTLFALEMGRQMFGQAVLIPDASHLGFPDDAHLVRTRDVGAQGELTGLFDLMGREQNAGRPLSQEAMTALARLMAIWLHRQIREASPTAPRVSAARRLTQAYCRRLVTDYASGSSMADHAEALGVTPTHLTRVTRSETGKTAAALLTERILHAARTRLILSDVPVRETARQLGFRSAAYFTKFIQNHTGQTPTGLRRSVSPPQ